VNSDFFSKKVSPVFIALVLAIFFFSRQDAFSAPIVITNGGPNNILLGPYLDYFEDRTGQLGILDVAGGGAVSFKASEREVPNFFWTKSTYWLRFSLQNVTDSANTFILEDGAPWTEYVELFVPRPDGTFSSEVSGSAVPFGRWAVQHPHILFTFELPPRESKTFFIRTRGDSELQLPLTIWQAPAFAEHDRNLFLLNGLLFGALGAVLIYNLFIYLSLKDENYLYYALYMVATIFLLMALHGLSFMYFPFWGPWLSRRHIGVGVWLFQLTAALFARKFLRAKQTAPALDKVLVLYAAISAGIALSSFFLDDLLVLSQITVVSSQAYPILMLVSGAVALRNGVREARFFLLAWICSLGSMILGLELLGVLPYHPVVYHNAMEFGLVAEAMLLSLALADRIKILREEKDAAQFMVVEHEREALRIAEEARARLEVEVRSRTEELGQSEARFRKFSNATFEGLLIHDNGIALDFNEMFEKMTGYGREDLIGKNIVDSFIPEEYKKLAWEMAASSSEEPYEIVGVRRDGTLINLELQGKLATFAGKSVRITAIRDISERKNREKELRESEERYRFLFEMAPEAIAIHSGGKILMVNAAAVRLVGAQSTEDLIGRSIMDFVHPDFWQVAIDRIKGMFESGDVAPMMDQKYFRMTGEIIDLEVMAGPIIYHGKPAVQTFMRDVTARKELERKLQEAKEKAENATKLKDKFVTLVSHDLKSPLLGVMELVKVMLSDEKKPLDKEHAGRLNKILNSSRGLVEMINKLLNINLLQTGTITPLKRKINCHKITEQRIEPLRHLSEKKGISIRNNVPRQLRMMADPDLFGECVSNLLSNAIKFCGQGCEITVFSPEGRPTTLAVRDNGAGVNEQFLPHIFSHETRTSSAGTSGERGYGLGLPYCNDIIAAHNGSLTVETEAGKGSTFYLTLPDEKPTVLVVDDQAVAREMARDYLKDLGVEVIEAEDGFSALEILKELIPLAIITDIHMPGMGGVELLTKLKGSPETRDLPVIVTTAVSEFMVEGTDVRTHVMKLGAADFVGKPFMRDDLVSSVRKIIAL